MRSVAEQQTIVRGLAHLMPTVHLPLAEAEGRVLAETVVAKVPVPPFTNSAMDGYAVRAEDVVSAPMTLAVVADIPAGSFSDVEIVHWQAARIMTGAPLPPGADAVVPVEQTNQPRGAAELPTRVIVQTGVTPGRHVRVAGENVQPGDVVLEAGAVLTAAALASIASVGIGVVEVYERPKVAVIATGDELVPAGEPLGPGQIPDSNSLLVAGLVRRFGGEVVAVRRTSDDPVAFRATILDAAETADVLVTTGGVSVGAFDVVREVLTAAEFTPVAMQPGKPQGSGKLVIHEHEVLFLGLPGNPVSVFVSAWVFLRELLGAMTGRESGWKSVQLPVAQGWTGPDGRAQYVPIVLTSDGVAPAHERHSGSHLVASLALADGLAVVAPEITEVNPGDLVDVHLVGREG